MYVSIMVDLQKNIKRLRELRGLTRTKLAQEAGVSQAFISFIEQGVKSPKLDKVEAIAKALGVPMKELFEEEIDENKSK